MLADAFGQQSFIYETVLASRKGVSSNTTLAVVITCRYPIWRFFRVSRAHIIETMLQDGSEIVSVIHLHEAPFSDREVMESGKK
jgi:hypothetical protein